MSSKEMVIASLLDVFTLYGLDLAIGQDIHALRCLNQARVNDVDGDVSIFSKDEEILLLERQQLTNNIRDKWLYHYRNAILRPGALKDG
jgi:hypothetical protein